MNLKKCSQKMYLTNRSGHQKCSIKMVFLKIHKYSQENTCARNSFVIKLQASGDCFCTKEILNIPDLVLILIPIEKAAALLASGLAGCLIK